MIGPLCLLLLVAQAPTPEAVRTARSHHEEAERLYEAGDLAGAEAEEHRAYAAVPSPNFLYTLGRIAEATARPLEAFDHFDRFLRSVPAGDPASAFQQDDARERLSLLASRIATLDIRCNQPGAQVRINGNLVGTTPIVFRVLPGIHHIVVTARGTAGAFEDTVSAGAGERVLVQTHVASDKPRPPVPPPTAAPATLATFVVPQSAPPAAPPVPSYRRWWFWAGIGAALVATSATIFILSRERSAATCGDCNWGSSRLIPLPM